MTEETAELTCQRCERSYVSEGDEEDRCPFCEASQHDCDICTEIGGETCISCGQWVCAGCWAGHADEDGGGGGHAKGRGVTRARQGDPVNPLALQGAG